MPKRHEQPLLNKRELDSLLNYQADVIGSGYIELVDRLMAEGYDQAASDMVRVLAIACAKYGVDFPEHVVDEVG